MNSDSLSLKKIERNCSVVVAQAFTVTVVTDLIKFFNVGKSMSGEQAAETVRFILEDYWFLKASEIKYCFDCAKKGMYGNGNMYDRIDGQVILSWLKEYCNNERETECINRQRTQGNDFRKQNEENIAALNIKVEKTIVPAMKRKAEQSQLERCVQSCMKRFDIINRSRPAQTINDSFRMIIYQGKKMTQEDYVKARLINLKVIESQQQKKVKK